MTQPGSAKKQASRLACVYKPRGAKKFPTCAQKRPRLPPRGAAKAQPAHAARSAGYWGWVVVMIVAPRQTTYAVGAGGAYPKQVRPNGPTRNRPEPAQKKRRRPTTMLAAVEVKTGSGLTGSGLPHYAWAFSTAKAARRRLWRANTACMGLTMSRLTSWSTRPLAASR